MLEWLQILFLGHGHRWESVIVGEFLVERCTICGKVKSSRPVSNECHHKWETIREGNLVSPNDPHGVPVGRYYDQKCVHCGKMQRTKL